VYSVYTLCNIGNINLNIPYKLNLRTIAANIILPPKGDSTWAFKSHVFKKIVGVLTAKAINIPQNKNNCVKKMKFPLNSVSKSLVLILDDILIMDNNKNKEPNNVYKNK